MRFLADFTTDPRFALVVFAGALSFLTASGRIGNADAFDQFYAANHWVLTGKLGVEHLPGGIDQRLSAEHGQPIPKRMFWPGQDGRYYQSHDLGNVLLFVPAAIVSRLLGSGSLESRLENPPDASKVAASLLFSLEAVVCVLLLFSILKDFMPRSSAARWAAVFLLCSFFITFTRMPWDVAAGGICGLFVFRQVLKVVRNPSGPVRDLVLLGVAGGLAATFRYSYAPFLGLAAAFAIVPILPRIPVKNLALAAGSFVVTVLPQLYYNKIRMGSFLVPGTTAPRYSHSPELSWQTFQGVGELLLAPDLSLFLFCPTLLMLIAVWRIPKELRMFAIGVLVSTALYMFVLGSLPHRVWSAFMGWGPRYLVPALPSLFALAVIATSYCAKPGRVAAIWLTLTGVVVNLPVLFTNWPLVQTFLGFPDKTNQMAFNPILGMWRALLEGFATGKHRLPDNASATEVTLTFPDWLVAHVGSVSPVLGVAIAIPLLIAVVMSLATIFLPSKSFGSGR